MLPRNTSESCSIVLHLPSRKESQVTRQLLLFLFQLQDGEVSWHGACFSGMGEFLSSELQWWGRGKARPRKCLGGSCNGNSQIGDYTLHWKPISRGSESYGLTLYLSLTLPKQNGTSASELGGLIEMMYVKGRRIVSGTQSALSKSEAFLSRPSPFC